MKTGRLHKSLQILLTLLLAISLLVAPVVPAMSQIADIFSPQTGMQDQHLHGTGCMMDASSDFVDHASCNKLCFESCSFSGPLFLVNSQLQPMLLAQSNLPDTTIQEAINPFLLFRPPA